MDLLISGDEKVVKALERELYFRSRKYNFTVTNIDKNRNIQTDLVTEKQDEVVQYKIPEKLPSVKAGYRPKGRPKVKK